MKRIDNALGKTELGEAGVRCFCAVRNDSDCPTFAGERMAKHLSGIPKLLALLVLLVVGPCVAQTPSSGPADFKFTTVDLKLLEVTGSTGN